MKIPKRTYISSDSYMSDTSHKILNFVEDRIALFEDYSFNQDSWLEVKDLLTTYLGFDLYDAEVRLKRAKNTLLNLEDDLYELLEKIRTSSLVVLQQNDLLYYRLHQEYGKRKRGQDMYFQCHRVELLFKSGMSKFVKKDLTIEFRIKTKELYELLDLVALAKAEERKVRIEHIQIGNELFEAVMNVCKIGQIIFPKGDTFHDVFLFYRRHQVLQEARKKRKLRKAIEEEKAKNTNIEIESRLGDGSEVNVNAGHDDPTDVESVG